MLRTWDRNEMLAFALRRGTRLRQRRRVVRSAAVVAALIAVGVPVVLVTARTEHDAARLRVTDARPTRTTITDDNSQNTETAQPSESGRPPASGAASSSHIAAPARPGDTGVGLAPNQTTTTSTTTAPLMACGAREVAAATTTDKPSYLAVDVVHVTATARNTSGHACALPSDTFLTVYDPSGRPVSEQGIATDYVAGSTWAPNQTLSYTFSWDQSCSSDQGCTAGKATRGDGYRAETKWMAGTTQYGPTSATFDLT